MSTSRPARITRLQPPAAGVDPASGTPKHVKKHQPKPEPLTDVKDFLTRLLTAEGYERYDSIIIALVRRGPKEPTVRKNNLAALRTFLEQHRGAVKVHNNFARVYNKPFEGKHERYSLPVYEDLEIAGPKPIRNGVDPSTGGQESNAGARPPKVVASQVTGRPDRRVESSTAHSLNTPSLNNYSRTRRASTVKAELGQMIHREQPQGQMVDETPDVDAVGTAAGPMNAVPPYSVHSAPPVPKLPARSQLDGITNAHGRPAVSSTPQAAGPDNARQQSALPVSITLPTHITSRNKQRAESYLAWLRHRQTRYPTAPPNMSECDALARRIGQSPWAFYDEVVYHWNLEAHSLEGEWYRTHRLEFLGKDPRFDEETMGRWEAWLKAGREEGVRRRWS